MPTHCCLFQFVPLCFHAQGPTNLHDTEGYSRKHKVTLPQVRETLGGRHFQTSRDLGIVFKLVLKGHKRTALWHFPQTNDCNLLPHCALSCFEGCAGHLSFIARSTSFSCNGSPFLSMTFITASFYLASPKSQAAFILQTIATMVQGTQGTYSRSSGESITASFPVTVSWD